MDQTSVDLIQNILIEIRNLIGVDASQKELYEIVNKLRKEISIDNNTPTILKSLLNPKKELNYSENYNEEAANSQLSIRVI